MSKAILLNGLGRYQEAMASARRAAEETPELFISAWALPELIEAAARIGQTQSRPPRLSASGRPRERPAQSGGWASRCAHERC